MEGKDAKLEVTAERTSVDDESTSKRLSPSPWRLLIACRASKVVTVEPIVFLFMFNTYLFLFAQQQYYFWRFGKEKLENTTFPWLNHSSFCISTDDLSKYTESNKTAEQVQASAGLLLAISTLPGLFVSVVVSLCLGPISDKFGRRLVFFSISIGILLQGVLTLFIIWFELSMYMFIFSGTISSFFGGFASCLLGSFAYIADVSSGRWRSIRIAVVEAMIFLGGALSQGTAGIWLDRMQCSFWPLIVLYIAFGGLLFLYTLVFLPEVTSKLCRVQNATRRPRGIQALGRGLKIFFCPTEYSTWKLWVCMITLAIMVTNFSGYQEITAFFVKENPLNWDVEQTGYYDVLAQVTHGTVLIFVLPVLVALSIPDSAIALIGLIFSSAMNAFTGLVTTTWEMFFIASLAGMEAMIIPSIRSIMSKQISAADQGSLFSFVASMEVLATAAATAFYPNIFPLTLKLGLRPGTSYFIMAVLCILPAPLLLVLLISHVKFWRRCVQQPRGSASAVVEEVGHKVVHVQDEEKEQLLVEKHSSSPTNETYD